jgi:hypothetical protein
MTTFTAQELFDKAYLGLITQGKQAWDAGCKYRTKDGLKCSIGFMIDDATAQHWDQIGTLDEIKFHVDPEDLPDWVLPNFPLLEDLQSVHDSLMDEDDFLPDFKRDMAKVAEKHGLKVPA